MQTRLSAVGRLPPVEVRADAGGKTVHVAGWAAVFYDATDPGTEFAMPTGWGDTIRERLMPGCFSRAVREDDVRCLFNHNADLILGRNRSGTLRLSVDAVGLRYDVDADADSPLVASVLSALRRGDVTGSSFSFEYDDVNWREVKGDDSTLILEVASVRLFDVGPVCYPAYTSTTAGVEGRRGAGPDPRPAPGRAGWDRGNAARKRLRILDL